MLESVYLLFVFVFGTVTGSFLNVCIYRLPKEKSIIKPRSFCPLCKKTVKWYDNIPILSFIFLGGKCRGCKGRIAVRYPIVELMTGLVFLGLYFKFGLSWEFAKFAFFFCLLEVVSFIDIDYHAIPAYLCTLGIGLGLALSLWESYGLLAANGISEFSEWPIYQAFVGLFIGLGFTYFFKLFGDIFIALLLHLRRQDSIEGEKESLGLGDVDFMGMAGVFLGWKQAILIFFVAPFLALIYTIFALIFKRSHLIPYLPYLSLAALIVFLWGEKILRFIF